jgi:hypothetical protein
MGSPAKLYQQEMHNNVGFFATGVALQHARYRRYWRFRRGTVRRQGSLRELGIATPGTREGVPQKMSYSASAERKVSAESGAIVAPARAGLSMKFAHQGGFIFEAHEVRLMGVADRMALSRDILNLYNVGVWKSGWHLIDAVYSAGSAIILGSEGHASEIVLEGLMHQWFRCLGHWLTLSLAFLYPPRPVR